MEKSGIIKKNSIFIKGEIQEDLDYIFQDECKLNNVQYFNATKELKIISLSKKIDHRVIKVDYKKSNSFEIKNAIETIFKVKVNKVNTSILRGKGKTFKGQYGYRKDTKRAIVTLQEGNTIDSSLEIK